MADSTSEAVAAYGQRPATPPVSEPWEDHAACVDHDRELFFPEPETHELAAPARAVCAACPVAEQCLEFALARPGLYGVWGGLTTSERRTLRQRAA